MGFTRKGARAALAFLPSLAITTLLSARVPAGGAGKGAMSDTWVFYTRSVGSAGTLGGSFTPEAALVRTDASIPGIPRIGFFRRPMAAGEWERLAGLVRSIGPPRSSGEHAPGTPMVSLGIMSRGKAEGELAPTEEPVFSKDEEAVEEVMGHAHRALEASASWGEAPIEPDGDAVLDVTIRNPGLVPVPFVHPGSRGRDPSGLSAVVARVGPDGAVVNAQEVGFSGTEAEMAAARAAAEAAGVPLDSWKTLVVALGRLMATCAVSPPM